MKEIHSEIDINAPAERVWKILTDFTAYPEWNPFIQHVRGKAEQGSHVHVRISGAVRMKFKATIIKADKNRKLEWVGNLGIPGLIDGRHVFEIQRISPRKVRFIQSEVFSGLLIPVIAMKTHKSTRRGFAKMNQALKELAENTRF